MSEVKVNKISPRTNCGTVTVGDSGDSVTVTAGVPVTVNGDLKSNALKAIDGGSIISQCGTNITLGASGDTINLAAGASQSGFGRTGTVDWDTTAKTASFTAVSGNGYFVNTTSGAITVTLPASPSAGDIVGFNDYARTFGTNNLTIARNGSNIQGFAGDATISTNGQSSMFVYVDGTKGWVPTEDQTTGNYGELYVTATGGTITTCGNYKIHTFTSPGTFTVTCAGNPSGNDKLEYLVVAGAGGGSLTCRGAGGGAGGFRFASTSIAPLTYPAKPLAGSVLTATAQGYPITVGAGGGGGGAGSNSIFSTIISAGGGQGGNCNSAGADGGSGGGGGGPGGGNPVSAAGSGNTPPVSPSQGNNGGTGDASPPGFGGGGGGALAAGSNGNSSPQPRGADGGIGGGLPTAFGSNGESCGSFRYYSGGGGAGYYGDAVPGGLGGTGGGGNGGGFDGSSGTPSEAGTANTGGGGGGRSLGGGGSNSGGSGIVVIRYKFQ